MCSACAIIRPLSSKSAVEQSRRSLMLAEKADLISTAPISSAIDRSELPRTWSSIFTLASRSRQHQRAIPIPIPHPPGGNEARRAVEGDRRRAFDVERLRRREHDLRSGNRLGCSHGYQLELAAAVGVAVPLLVCAMERLCQARLERHGELERLPRVAEVGVAIGGQVLHFTERADVR